MTKSKPNTLSIDDCGHSLGYFMDLARGGIDLRRCSSGEHAAALLAAAILDNVQRLDARALEGLLEFTEKAATHNDTLRRML